MGHRTAKDGLAEIAETAKHMLLREPIESSVILTMVLILRIMYLTGGAKWKVMVNMDYLQLKIHHISKTTETRVVELAKVCSILTEEHAKIMSLVAIISMTFLTTTTLGLIVWIAILIS